jgi:hypothetical protein
MVLLRDETLVEAWKEEGKVMIRRKKSSRKKSSRGDGEGSHCGDKRRMRGDENFLMSVLEGLRM